MKNAGLLETLILCLFVVACGSPPPADLPMVEGDWAQWRGPNRDGKIPFETKGPPPEGAAWELWRRPVGSGFSAPIVADGMLFLTEAREEEERLTAWDAATGELRFSLFLGPLWESYHGDGPRASAAVADGRIFAVGSRGRLIAADAKDGELLWQADLWEYSGRLAPSWGYAGSPWIDEGRVVVQADGIFAFDISDGRLLWRTGKGLDSYASPLPVTLADGSRQGVGILATEAVGFEPGTGELLWTHPWSPPLGFSIADPVAVPPVDGRAAALFLSATQGGGATVVDLLQTADGRWEIRERWKLHRMRNHWSSSVVVDGFVYGFDEELFACQRLADGELMWKARGFGGGGAPIVVGSELWVLSHDGDLVWIDPDPAEYRELGRRQVLAGPCHAPPTVAGRHLFVRDRRELAAFDLVDMLPP